MPKAPKPKLKPKSKPTRPSPSASPAPSTAAASAPSSSTSSPLTIAPKSVRMSYSIGRGETGVLSFEPYKSAILPLWRFRTPAIARVSADALTERFHAYGEATVAENGGEGIEGDFVGMDMCRKFLQMGMTRSLRYANHKGGRKYVYVKNEDDMDDDGDGQKHHQGGEGDAHKVELERSSTHAGAQEKRESAAIFRVAWEKAKKDEVYLLRRREWEADKKVWIKSGGGDGGMVPKKEEEA